MKPDQTDQDRAEVGEHNVSTVPGRVSNHDIWGCERCGEERVHLEHFENFECED